MFICTIWKVINPIDVFRLIDSIDPVLPMPKMKLADPAVLISNLIVLSSFCKVFNWLIFSVDRVAVFESISNLLNSEESYLESIEALNTYGPEAGDDAIEKISSDEMKRCLNAPFAKVSVAADDSDASKTLSEVINCSFTSALWVVCTLNVSSFGADALIVKFSKN